MGITTAQLKRWGKKGIIFSIIAVTIAELVFFMFSSTYTAEINADDQITYNRISSVNKEINRFFEYVPEAGSFAGFSALESMYLRMQTTKTGLGNFETVFLPCIMYGTGDECGINEYNLEILLADFAKEIEDTRTLQFEVTIEDFGLTQEDYWYLDAWVNISLFVEDTYASWSLSRIVPFEISIIGVHDPAYIFINEKYGGSASRRIYPNSVSGPTWNKKLFADFFTGKEYHVSENGTCLSERFEGTFIGSPSACSIESIVDAKEHPGLLTPANYSIAHIDFQVLEEMKFPCHDISMDLNNDDNPRVGIVQLNKNITLDFVTASRYGLISPSSFDETTGLLIANACS